MTTACPNCRSPHSCTYKGNLDIEVKDDLGNHVGWKGTTVTYSQCVKAPAFHNCRECGFTFPGVA